MFEITWMEIAGHTVTISGLVYFLWTIWVGWIFSTVGAFGGIMAGVGHISVLGLGKYGSTLKGEPTDLGGYQDAGNYVTDNIRFSNNLITLINSISGTINWQTQKRLVWPAGIALGIGAIIGAQIAIWTTGGALGVKVYKGIFGLCTWAVSFYMFYQITPKMQAKKSAGKEAAEKFKKRVQELRQQNRLHELEGVENLTIDGKSVGFEFFKEHFEVKHYTPFVYGILVGFISTLIGVGGGFLLVPFLTYIGIPMFIAPGISLMAIILNQISAVIGWFLSGQIFPLTVIVGWAGILVGSFIGARTQKYLPMKFLYGLFGLLAFYVGLRYIMSGFLGIQLPPA